MKGKILTKEQALQKLKHYCSYQERSHYEVRQKLWDLGVRRTDHDDIISTLIEEDYLNEERFAKLFAGGKFRMKQWGRRKIIHALKEKQISEYNIKKAMNEIDEGEYISAIKKLAKKKYTLLKKEQYLIRRKKTMDHLVQKGYEPELVGKIVIEVSNEQ